MSKFGTVKSMTGYGRASVTLAYGRFEVEIQGVNRRHLEVALALPKALLRFESEVRKLITEWAARGQVNLYVVWKPEGKESVTVVPDLALAKALKEGWEKVARELNITSPLTLELLSREEILICEKNWGADSEVLKGLLDASREALEAFDEAKRKEGKVLAADLLARASFLKELISKIEERAFDAVAKIREKLSQRLEELFQGKNENEEKILKEVALYAEKMDITEEIVRFKSHVDALHETLQKPLVSYADAKGKRVEFLLQEMLREINTVGSKSNSSVIAGLVVDAKCELERMRESVQNIE